MAKTTVTVATGKKLTRMNSSGGVIETAAGSTDSIPTNESARLIAQGIVS